MKEFGLKVVDCWISDKSCLYSILGLKFPVSGEKHISNPPIIGRVPSQGRFISHFRDTKKGQGVLLYWLFLKYLQFKIINIAKWHIWGVAYSAPLPQFGEEVTPSPIKTQTAAAWASLACLYSFWINKPRTTLASIFSYWGVPAKECHWKQTEACGTSWCKGPSVPSPLLFCR